MNWSFFYYLVRAQVVGWPPIRSFRKNMVSNNPPKTEEDANGKLLAGCHYVKVSMDGAPYLRKVDLTIYNSYNVLSSALEKMFSCFKDGNVLWEHYMLIIGFCLLRLLPVRASALWDCSFQLWNVWMNCDGSLMRSFWLDKCSYVLPDSSLYWIYHLLED